MKLEDAVNRTWTESAIVALAREQFPNVPEQLLRSIFSHGFAMGSLHGFSEARATLEQTLMEYANGTAH